jgi:hypothetical protein
MSSGVCFRCDLSFGKLEFIGILACPLCKEEKQSVKRPDCLHTMCIDCFKLCHYGNHEIPAPKFPYDSEKDRIDYYDNPYDPRWTNDPLIKKYNDAFIIFEKILMDNFKKEESLRICAICRK